MKQRRFRLVDVAPTMARVLGLEMPLADGRPIEIEGWGCHSVVLLIVDSLGYELYRVLEGDLPNMRALARDGLLLKAESVATSTTPAIASILTGLLPHNHGVYDTKAASESNIRSLMETASMKGVSTAVVMEEMGARTFEGFVRVVKGVPGGLSALVFDQEVRKGALEALATAPRVLVAHFIGIDRVAHQGGDMEAIKNVATAIDDHVGAVAKASRPRTLIIVCGDHPLHAGELKDAFDSNQVALMLGRT